MITTLKQNISKARAILFLCATAATATAFGMEERLHEVTVTNLLRHKVKIMHPIWVDNEITPQTNDYITGKDLDIEPNTLQSLTMASKEGKAWLLFLLPDCHTKTITLNLEKDQKNIFIKAGPNAANEVIIEDETKQLAWTFFLVNEQ